MGLKHIVITMVSRDDLEDGGASALVHIIETLHTELPTATIEVLASDLKVTLLPYITYWIRTLLSIIIM